MDFAINHLWWQILDEVVSNEIVDDEFVVFEQLFHEVKEGLCFFDEVSFDIVFLVFVFIAGGGNDAFDNISQNEHDPFGDVDLEHLVVPYKFCDDVVNAVVKLNELFPLIVLFTENGSGLFRSNFQVLFHVEQQLEQ